MEEVAGVEVGGEIGSDELFVLSTGLAARVKPSAIGNDGELKDAHLPPRYPCPNDRSSDQRCIRPNCAVPKCPARR